MRQLIGKIADVPGDEIGEPIRLGQMQIGQNPRPMILRVDIKTVDGKEKIMRNVCALNVGVAFDKRVYMNHDSTPTERERYRTLKTEMTQRTENGERDLVIRNMKITKRQRYGQEADNTNWQRELRQDQLSTFTAHLVDVPLAAPVPAQVNVKKEGESQCIRPAHIDKVIVAEIKIPLVEAQFDVPVVLAHPDEFDAPVIPAHGGEFSHK